VEDNFSRIWHLIYSWDNLRNDGQRVLACLNMIPHQINNLYYLTSNYQNTRFMEMAQGLTIILSQVLMKMVQRRKVGLVERWTWNGCIEMGSLIKYLWEASNAWIIN
jgi:hypothetical protein